MADQPKDPFSYGKLGPLELRNRITRAGAFEGMTPAGLPGERLIGYHRSLARGGVALTTVAYCSCSHDGLTFREQLWARAEIEPGLSGLADAVHAEGAAVVLQVGHAGYFANGKVTGTRPVGPSSRLCLYTLTRSAEASAADLERLRQDFARAARLVRRVGFDGMELHLGHGYLLSQFLSPYTNRRRDGYGGPLENRMRFPLEVVRAVREALGPRLALLVKMNLEDGFAGGFGLEEAVELARALEREGADALVPSGGFVSRTPFFMLRGKLPVREMVHNEESALRRAGLRLFGRFLVPRHAYRDLFFFERASRLLEAVRIPVVLIGGVRTSGQMQQALDAGFEFVALARPLIHDPGLVNKLKGGELSGSACQPCNLCVAEMERGGIRCPLVEKGADHGG